MAAPVLRALMIALGSAAVLTVAEGQQPKPHAPKASYTALNALPDWGGVWQMVGPTVFDTSTVEPSNGRAGEPGVRERPPYNDEWEARYRKNIEGIRNGVFPDPGLLICQATAD